MAFTCINLPPSSVHQAISQTHTHRHPDVDPLARVMILGEKSFRKALVILSLRLLPVLVGRDRNNSLSSPL